MLPAPVGSRIGPTVSEPQYMGRDMPSAAGKPEVASLPHSILSHNPQY